jgi:hypothetical protein
MVFEPREGGHIYDRGVDGSECHWARVLAYEPPTRLVFSWDINLQWQLESDPQRTSEVEVLFVAEGPDRTRVVLEHRNIDRHGEGWEQMRDVVASPDVDPAGVWGLAIVEAESEAAVRTMGTKDPAVSSQMASFDVYAMPSAVVREGGP